MSKRNKIFALGVLFCFFILFIFRPYEKVDSEMVNQRLRALEEPFRAVNICCLGDGGSIGFEIVDRTGKKLAFCLPAPLDEPSLKYNKLFIGSIYYSESGASEVLNGYHTKLRLAEILRAQPTIDTGNDYLVYLLSGRWRDLCRWIIRKYAVQGYDD
jgi:hypothetical protein